MPNPNIMMSIPITTKIYSESPTIKLIYVYFDSCLMSKERVGMAYCARLNNLKL